jgi:riboflavin kinase/FMN adenylyltransferase
VTSKPSANIINLTENPALGEFTCAIGVFDGVHQGHQYIIGEAKRQARELGIASYAFTFDIDPDELFCKPEEQRKLLTNADRIEMLATCDIDGVIVIPFNASFAGQTPFDFLNATLAAHGEVRGIHVGSDFRFGAKAAGTVAELRLWGADRGCTTFAHALLPNQGLPVTATRIRNALQAGDLELANKLLTRPYYLRARVAEGRQVGKELGFATANLELEQRLTRPADGVYAGVVPLDGVQYKAAISVGVPATFANVPPTIEAHLLDFDGDLYGHELKLFFMEYLREMHAFSSVEELKRTVQSNITHVRETDYPKVS